MRRVILKKVDQKGFAHLGLILLALLVIGAVGFAGWRVYSGDKPTKLGSASVTNSSTSTPKTTEQTNSKVPDGYVEYVNKDLGFKFTYPKTWGDVVRTGDDTVEIRTDGLGGRVFRADFENDDSKTFPRGWQLSGDNGAGISEGMYEGGYIQKGDKYYSSDSNTGGEVQIPADTILAVVKAKIGTVLIVRPTSVVTGTKIIEVLVNLPKGNTLTGLDLWIKTGDYDFADEGKIDAQGLETLKQIAQTFEAT